MKKWLEHRARVVAVVVLPAEHQTVNSGYFALVDATQEHALAEVIERPETEDPTGGIEL